MKVLRLDKLLSHMGWGTRKEIKKIMKKGLVTVDGEVVTDPAFKVAPREMTVKVGEETVVYREFIYLMMNKPAGYVSATEDERERTVLDLLEPEHRAFLPFPVGRLDKDTEGLLLLTNNGSFSHNMTSPKKKVPKTYYSVIKGEVGEDDRKAFSGGIVLDDGYRCLPAELTVLRTGQESEVCVTIYEGKFHQVKRMFLARGKEVLYLKRISMGDLQLDENLKPGQYRELTEKELDLINPS